MRWLLLAALLAVGGLLLAVPGTASAAGPVTCRVGAVITSLRGFNYAANTFDAAFWVWADCPTKAILPIKTMEFVNANRVITSHYAIYHERGVYWSQEKVDGTFRYEWNLGAFPFDRHTLDIQIEDDINDVHSLVYAPDTANSEVERLVKLREWKISGYELNVGTYRYGSNFGDPTLPPGTGTTYSHLTIEITVQRTDLGEFFLLFAPVLIAIALGILGFFLPTDDVTHRVELIGAAIFVIVINLLDISTHEGIAGASLLGGLHVLALVYLLGFAVITILTWRMAVRGKEHRATRIDRVSAIVSGLSFVLLSALVTGITAALS